WRGRWGRRAENILQDPFPADHRRSPVRTRGIRQNRALSEQPATRAVGGKQSPPESFGVHARNPVVPGQTLVEERIVGVQQVEHAAILADDTVEEQLRLALEGLTQIVVEVKEQFRTGPERG